MKKWYRSNIVKLILVVALLGAVVLGAACGALAVGMASQDYLLWEDSSDTYIESEGFTSKVFTDVQWILRGLEAGNMLSLEQAGGKGRIIDLQEVYDGKDPTFQNTSGLAYSIGDLKDWAGSIESADLTDKNVIVCVPEDGREEDYYYYYDEFCSMVENGDIELELEEMELDGASEEEVIKELLGEVKHVQLYSTDYALRSITDKKRNMRYECVFPVGSACFMEKYPPVGADNLLEVLNKNPNWQGRIMDAYSALEQIMMEIMGMTEAEDVLADNYQEGNTNLTYFYVDPDRGRVYTNKSIFAEKPYGFEDYNKVLEEVAGMEAFAIIKPKLEECVSNMNFGDESGLMVWQHTVKNNSFSDDCIFAVAADGEFSIEDSYASANRYYESYIRLRRPVMGLFVLSIVLFLISAVWLTVIAGKRGGDEEIHLNGFDRIYTEIAAAVVCAAGALPPAGVIELAGYKVHASDTVFPFLLAGIGLYVAMVCLAGYLSFVRRLKARTLWKNSVLRHILKAARIVLRKLMAVLEVYSRNTLSKIKLTLMAGVFLLVQFMLTGFFMGGMVPFFFLLIVFDGAALVYVLWKADGIDKILEGLKRIFGGDLQYKIPTDRLRGDQKNMAEYINNIGSGLDAAVDSSLKNERMKTELITNVSHDIKTPLTSIINYVDLLKRENFQDPKICGYLEVLEAKAQRLKVLTEDVVEASKASSGTLTLEMVNLDFSEMLYQVMGEFEEKFEERNLTLMVHLTEEPGIIRADGRRLWRVLENVFNNVVKYALEGTRVYVQTTPEKGRIVFSLKNISAQALNISAEQLTERFIRGDVSRNTEGSGLGLSIAKSLTELQGGDFRLYVDGDLFKVIITFPLVKTGEKGKTK